MARSVLWDLRHSVLPLCNLDWRNEKGQSGSNAWMGATGISCIPSDLPGSLIYLVEPEWSLTNKFRWWISPSLGLDDLWYLVVSVRLHGTVYSLFPYLDLYRGRSEAIQSNIRKRA